MTGATNHLMFDLFAGLGGATEGFLASGAWRCIGIDNERHEYGDQRYPAQLWLQDIHTIHGSQLRNADLIWASPPCQEYSYMAMPFSRGKAKAAAYRAMSQAERDVTLNALFLACFRIQREASAAAGRYIPMVVENVKGAQPWVGPAKAHFGSFYLWGDVAMIGNSVVAGAMKFGETVKPRKTDGRKVPGFNFHDNEKTGMPGRSFQSAAVDGAKIGGDWFSDSNSTCRKHSSRSAARKQASAEIAKIPLALSSYLAGAFLRNVQI